MSDVQTDKKLWYIRVSKKGGEDIDELVIRSRQRRWAERIGLLFAADHYDLKSSELQSRSEPYVASEHGKVTHETHEYLAAAAEEQD